MGDAGVVLFWVFLPVQIKNQKGSLAAKVTGGSTVPKKATAAGKVCPAAVFLGLGWVGKNQAAAALLKRE